MTLNKLSLRNETTDNTNAELYVIKPIGGGIFQSWRIKLSNFLKSFATTFIDFIPQVSDPAHTEGRMFYCDEHKALSVLNDIPDVKLNLGEEMWERYINNSGAPLVNGKAGYLSDVTGEAIECKLAIASNLNQSTRTLGLFTNNVVNGSPGYITVFGHVHDIDTSAWPVNTVLFLSADTAGELTSVKPLAPNYIVQIGVVIVQHATAGIIDVNTKAFNGSDTDINVQGIINGIVTQTPDIAVSVDTGIIYADVTNEAFPTKNLPFLLDGIKYELDTLTGSGIGGAARVVVPPGASDILKQNSFLYITLVATVPTLTISTTAPAVPSADLGVLAVYNATRTAAEGRPFNYRRSNNAINSLSEGIPGAYGLMSVMLRAMRFKLGSGWLTGQDATTTIDNSNIKVALSAGEGAQLHKSNLPAFDGNSYFIYNTIANAVTYAASLNLTDIVTDAAGVTLLTNNTFYTIRLYYQLNSNGVGNSVIATRPLGSYSNSAEAISDPLNYNVNINDTDIEENIYKLYDIVIGRTGALGVNIALIQLTNLRTKIVGGAGGGGGAGGTSTDDKVRISAADTINSYLNDKVVAGLGIIKTILNPGTNEQIEIKATAAAVGVIQSKSFVSPSTAVVTNTSNTVAVDTDLIVSITTLSAASVLKVQYIAPFGNNNALQIGAKVNVQKNVDGAGWVDVLFGSQTSNARIKWTNATATSKTIISSGTQIDSPSLGAVVQFKVTFVNVVNGQNVNYEHDQGIRMITVNEVIE